MLNVIAIIDDSGYDKIIQDSCVSRDVLSRKNTKLKIRVDLIHELNIIFFSCKNANSKCSFFLNWSNPLLKRFLKFSGHCQYQNNNSNDIANALLLVMAGSCQLHSPPTKTPNPKPNPTTPITLNHLPAIPSCAYHRIPQNRDIKM